MISRTLHTTVLLLWTAICLSQTQKGLVAYFSFNDGRAINEVTGGTIKAVGTSYVKDRFGNPGKACYLHGTVSSYLNLGTDPRLKPRAGTLSLWVKVDIIMLGGRGFQFNPIIRTRNLQDQDFVEAYSIGFDFRARKLEGSTTLDSTRQIRTTSGDAVTLNEWHHVVLCYNDDSLTMYFDGARQASQKKGFVSRFNPNDSVLIGSTGNWKNERYLCGSVDDIAIYDRVLSNNEIQQLYSAPDPNRMNQVLRWTYRIIGLAVFVLLLVWLLVRRYRSELERQKATNAMIARLNEVETRAIRMQMNPHFMFNSLNTLQRFILESDLKNAQEYLTRFSRLLRKLIESSESEAISLSEEIEILKNYIEIERLRFEVRFDYEFRVSVANTSQVMIPFMMIQPLIENAIWHGLLKIKSDRKLVVSFESLDGYRLRCRVEDNGPGISPPAVNLPGPKKKSMALDFIRQRLEIIKNLTGISGSLTLSEMHNENGTVSGTRAEIIIPILK